MKSYTIADGLMSDGEILHMIQDSRGYLWICGSLGISRFDGHAFRNYGQADGLPVQGAYYALEAKDGTLWFGTSRGLARYVPIAGAQKRFVMYSLGEPPAADGTNLADDIHMLCEDPNGGLWIGSARGLYHATPSADSLHAHLVLRPDVPAGAEPPGFTRIVSLFSDSHRVLWAGTHYAGIYRILPGGAMPLRVGHVLGARSLSRRLECPIMISDSSFEASPHGREKSSAYVMPFGNNTRTII